MKDIYNPIILDPPGASAAEGWRECDKYVAQCGGLMHEDGKPNWRAAFGADPGISSCPRCGAHHWAFGRIIECYECAFTFPTDWWLMYSYGVQGARHQQSRGDVYDLERRTKHPYYKYGREHPCAEPWEEKDKVDWATVVGPMKEYPK